MKRGGARPGAGRKRGLPPRATREQKATLGELAREHTDVAMATLVGLCKRGKSESARATAAQALLDRGYGRSVQAHNHSGAVGTYDLTKVSDADLDRLEAILGPLAVAGGDPGGEDPPAG